MALTSEQTGAASLIVRDGGETILEIRDLRLCTARFRISGRSLLDEDVPLPLYWEQYASHQDPERNAGADGAGRVLSNTGETLTIECVGKTGTGSILSTYTLTVSRLAASKMYVIDVLAALRVEEGCSWHVTPNPSHGEVEFCNFWPFHLRPGHRWSDGADFTVHDIIWTCNTVIGSEYWSMPSDWMQATDGASLLVRATR